MFYLVLSFKCKSDSLGYIYTEIGIVLKSDMDWKTTDCFSNPTPTPLTYFTTYARMMFNSTEKIFSENHISWAEADLPILVFCGKYCIRIVLHAAGRQTLRPPSWILFLIVWSKWFSGWRSFCKALIVLILFLLRQSSRYWEQ